MHDIKTLFTDQAQRDADDIRALRTGPDGGFTMADVTWTMVKTVATGRTLGGIILYPEEMVEARRRLGKLLDIAVAGGWRGIDLLETLIAKGVANDRLEALARKAGAFCDRRPDLADEFLTEIFGADHVGEFVKKVSVPAGPVLDTLPTIKPPVTLRRPMSEHFKDATFPNGEAHVVMSAEAVVWLSAQNGYDPKEASDCADGGAMARAMVVGVLKAATASNYSRTESLRMALTTGPFGDETMAAIEHLVGECGHAVLMRGLGHAGFTGWGD